MRIRHNESGYGYFVDGTLIKPERINSMGIFQMGYGSTSERGNLALTMISI